MYFVYILQSIKSGKFYTGSTNNLERRLGEHNAGKSRSTRNKGPYKVVYFEKFYNISLARKREYKIKSYKSGEAFKKLLNI